MLNYFHLFSLPESYQVDATALSQAYQRLQNQYHPDRHVGKPAEEQHRTLLMASEVNRGWKVLRSPVERAGHLLEIHTGQVETSGVVLAAAFLLEQIDWREQLEAAASESALLQIQQSTLQRLAEEGEKFAAALQRQEWTEARLYHAYMQFFQRLCEESLARLERLDEEKQ